MQVVTHNNYVLNIKSSTNGDGLPSRPPTTNNHLNTKSSAKKNGNRNYSEKDEGKESHPKWQHLCDGFRRKAYEIWEVITHPPSEEKN